MVNIFPRIILSCIVCALITVHCKAQVLQTVEIVPQFEGSTSGLKQWLDANMEYPQEAIKNQEEGRVVVKFVIASDGSIANPEVTKSVSPSLDAEALRLVSQMPKWIPASQDGQPCSVEYSLPIRFKLPAAAQQATAATAGEQDNWKELPGHKTYDGPFAAFGAPKDGGKAKYQYIEDADRTRVFDGEFEYQAIGFTAKGRFSNDYQVGRWEYTSNGRTAILTFDENGIPNGEFVVYSLLTQLVKTEQGRVLAPYLTGVKYWGLFESGYISQIEYVTSSGVRPVFQYSRHEIENAYIRGDKSIEFERYRTRYGTEWGYNLYRIDNQTGDKVSVRFRDTEPDVSDHLLTVKLDVAAFWLRSTTSKYNNIYFPKK